MSTRTVSQKQIADDLGVSQSLVSLVLNGRRKGIGQESYERIWEHALRLGYKPKGMSSVMDPPDIGMKVNVGFVLRAGLTLYTQSNFFSHVQHGLHEALEEFGINTVFLGSEDSLDEAEFAKAIRAKNTLMGLVLLGEMKSEFFQSIRQMHNRIVSVSASYPGLCHSVVSNEDRSLELLVEHLVTLGHKKFAWLGGNRELSRQVIRQRGLRQALRLYGVTLDDRYCVELDEGERRDGREAAQKLLERRGDRDFPTAWICFNGLMARGALSYLQQQQIRIPDEISIAAVDATRVCEEDDPTITGAGANPEKMGRKAGELVISSTGLEDEIFTDTMLASQLSVRSTTGPAPVAKGGKRASGSKAKKT